MAAARESQTHQQFTARNSSYLDHMAMPNLDKNSSLPYFPQKCTTANPAFVGQCASDLPSSNAGQHGAVGDGVRPPYCNIPYPTGDPYQKGSQYALPRGLGAVDKPSVCAPQRRFLIFDQCKNHTRLFISPSFSPLDQIFTSQTPASTNASLEKVANHVDQCILTKPMVEEKWDENHLSDGECEMDEDSEEINALLYSDSDDDDDCENDEVTSTGHSPLLLLDEPTEEVASSDYESQKRRRLLGGKYEKSSLESSGPPRGNEDDNGVESRCIGDDNGAKRVKIREALKMLESIIPGLDERDPLSVIDGAVAYLKAMKPEAESLRRRRSSFP